MQTLSCSYLYTESSPMYRLIFVTSALATAVVYAIEPASTQTGARDAGESPRSYRSYASGARADSIAQYLLRQTGTGDTIRIVSDTTSGYAVVLERVGRAAPPSTVATSGYGAFRITNTQVGDKDFAKRLVQHGMTPQAAEAAAPRLLSAARSSVAKRLTVIVTATSATLAVIELHQTEESNRSVSRLDGKSKAASPRVQRPWYKRYGKYLVAALFGAAVLTGFVVAQRRGIMS